MPNGQSQQRDGPEPVAYRSLAFSGSMDDANRATISEQEAAEDAESPNFEQSILDTLQGRHPERPPAQSGHQRTLSDDSTMPRTRRTQFGMCGKPGQPTGGGMTHVVRPRGSWHASAFR
jgi:hypothetical protein